MGRKRGTNKFEDPFSEAGKVSTLRPRKNINEVECNEVACIKCSNMWKGFEILADGEEGNINEDEEEVGENMGEDKGDKIIEEEVEQIYLKAPIKPSHEEVEKHRVTHFPFRAWCKHCIKGRAKCPGHYVVKSGEVDIPIISIDYALSLIHI